MILKEFWARLDKPCRMLVVGLLVVLIGSFLAGLFHTSFYSVKISRIEFETERGTLTGLLYMPKGAGPDDPRPVIVTTHGYLNSKEMQDAPAIEMSRRGYIVLALDMYDHGDSRWANPIPPGGHFGTFWIYSQLDAANYMYDQPFTKKDADGNAYIAVSGHSMGGFSSFIAMYFDELAALQKGYRTIYTGISVGSDFSYARAVASQEQFQAAFGSRTVGMIAAHYDEFFFNKSDEEKTAQEKAITGTVVFKDFPATNSGKAFLGLAPSDPDGQAGQFYTVQSGDLVVDGQVLRGSEQGRRIIYTPREIHPWNHFSKTTTAHLIEFYTEAFAGVTSPNQARVNLSPNNQIWWLKETFNLVALIGFFITVLAIAQIVITLPFFKNAVVPVPEPVGGIKSDTARRIYWLIAIAVTLLPAIYFPGLINKNPDAMRSLIWGTYIITALAIVWVVSAFTRQNEGDAPAVIVRRAVVILIFGAALAIWLVRAQSFLNLGSYFNQPTTNQIAYWGVASGLIAALVNVIAYYVDRQIKGAEFASYGIVMKPMVIVASLAAAVVSIILGYIVLWLMQWIFGVDFRIWTLAVRTFKVEHFRTAMRYLPYFFVFYAINTIAVNANTRGLKRGSCLTAVLLNAGGLALWLLYQYGRLFAVGVAAYPDQTLNGILLFALTPILAIAAVYARKLFDKTGNIWLAAFLNSILFTMITAANTAMFWNLMS